MRKHLLLCLLSFAFLSACNTEAPPPAEEEAPPPPPTADELYGRLRQPMEPVFQAAASNSSIGNGQRQQAVNGLQPVKLQMAAEPNAPEAFVRFVRDVEDLIKQGKSAENYRVVKAGIMAYKLFEPSEKKYQEDEEYADLVLARPSVKIQGFFEVDGEPNVFLEVTDADDETKKETYKVREGEEFHTVLQLERVIGNNQAIEVRYLPIDQAWVVDREK